MATDQLRAAVRADKELDEAALFLTERFGRADLTELINALDDPHVGEGEVERIAEALGTNPETLLRTFESLRRLAASYEAEFPAFREYRAAWALANS